MTFLIRKSQKYFVLFLISTIHGALAQNTIVITEVMIDPKNAKLPPHEYLELYNPTSKAINLQDFKLEIGDKSIPLPETYLASKQYVVIADAKHIQLFEQFGNTIAATTWAALPNSKGTIKIKNSHNLVIDSVSYNSDWHLEASKRAGGWSLERINPHITCNESIHWSTSRALMGGTPGQRNSVWDESHVPALNIKSATIESRHILVTFNLPPRLFENIDNTSFSINSNDFAIADYEILGDSIKFKTSADIPHNRLYELHIENLSCCGDLHKVKLPFIHATRPHYNDIIINELLFNPKAGGVDFVEIYNRSGHTIDLQGWFLNNKRITDKFHPFDSDDFRVLTNNGQTLLSQYPSTVSDNIIELPSIASYPNERGEAWLSYQQQTIDSLYYTSQMHQPFLSDPKGYSLERQQYHEDTNAEGNFTSASALSGGATPGYTNSKTFQKESTKNTVYLRSRTCSPNADGFEDYLEIAYEFTVKNPILNIHIYDDKGRLINRLIRNKSSSHTGVVEWHGLDESGIRCKAGIYIMKAEVYTAEGYTRTYKSSFLLVNVK